MTDLVLDCGQLINGTKGEPIADARVLIAEGRIEDCGPIESINLPEDADQVRYPNSTVMPGLIDAHLHLSGFRSTNPVDLLQMRSAEAAAHATADLRALLAAGFTTVRDLGSDTGIGLRNAVSEGEIPGPRVFTSGRWISQTGGHGDRHALPYPWAREENKRGHTVVADGPAECRKEARKRIRDGVDLIKIMTTGGVFSRNDEPEHAQLTDAEIQAIVEEAHRVDIPVASHAQGREGILNALANGVDTIEHGIYLDEEVIDELHATGAILVPTLAVAHQLCEQGEDQGVSDHAIEKAKRIREVHIESSRQAYEADVPIALGSDFMGQELLPHGDNALEAELFVDKVGMDELDAIRAGTSVAAKAIPDDDIGSLEPGKTADVIVVENDPLEDITALRDVKTVFKAGQEVAI